MLYIFPYCNVTTQSHYTIHTTSLSATFKTVKGKEKKKRQPCTAVCVRVWNMHLVYISAQYISFSFSTDDKSLVRQTLGLPYAFLKEQSNDEWINARSQANTSQPDKKDSPMTIGGHWWPGEWSMGYAPQRKPVMERIAIRGKIK